MIQSYAEFVWTPPSNGVPVEIAPGVLWLRLPLPYRLDHVNVYFIEDDGGWAVLDTGLGDAPTEAIWQSLLDQQLPGPLTRIIVTHFHPDHAGMAGWIAEHSGKPVYMSETEYLVARHQHLDPKMLEAEPVLRFWQSHGLDREAAWQIATRGHEYLKIVRTLPPTFRRVCANDELELRHRKFRVITGAGHSPEQVMLYCKSDRLFFAADQVLNQISPNVGVSSIEPDGDFLGRYLRSLHDLARQIPDDVVILPGHGLPFHGLHRRLSELHLHHQERCALILEACRSSDLSAAELVPVIFQRRLNPYETGFALAEVLSHLNYLVCRGRLEATSDSYGNVRMRLPP